MATIWYFLKNESTLATNLTTWNIIIITYLNHFIHSHFTFGISQIAFTCHMHTIFMTHQKYWKSEAKLVKWKSDSRRARLFVCSVWNKQNFGWNAKEVSKNKNSLCDSQTKEFHKQQQWATVEWIILWIFPFFISYFVITKCIHICIYSIISIKNKM